MNTILQRRCQRPANVDNSFQFLECTKSNARRAPESPNSSKSRTNGLFATTTSTSTASCSHLSPSSRSSGEAPRTIFTIQVDRSRPLEQHEDLVAFKNVSLFKDIDSPSNIKSRSKVCRMHKLSSSTSETRNENNNVRNTVESNIGNKNNNRRSMMMQQRDVPCKNRIMSPMVVRACSFRFVSTAMQRFTSPSQISPSTVDRTTTGYELIPAAPILDDDDVDEDVQDDIQSNEQLAFVSHPEGGIGTDLFLYNNHTNIKSESLLVSTSDMSISSGKKRDAVHNEQPKRNLGIVLAPPSQSIQVSTCKQPQLQQRKPRSAGWFTRSNSNIRVMMINNNKHRDHDDDDHMSQPNLSPSSSSSFTTTDTSSLLSSPSPSSLSLSPSSPMHSSASCLAEYVLDLV